jgi:hypothetical protein
MILQARLRAGWISAEEAAAQEDGADDAGDEAEEEAV